MKRVIVLMAAGLWGCASGGTDTSPGHVVTPAAGEPPGQMGSGCSSCGEVAVGNLTASQGTEMGEVLLGWDPPGGPLEAVDELGDVGSYTGIVLSADGTVHISYYDFTNADLKHAWLPVGGVWTMETVDTDGNVGKYSDLAIGSGSPPTLHISYFGGATNPNDFLKHAIAW